MARAPRILAFDTSSRLCVCGLVEGESVVAGELGASPTAPSEGLLPMIDGCLERVGWTLADLDAVVPGLGPGSFTGTRIALATAKGICLGSGLPVVAVSSLEAAALDAAGQAVVVVALDARKGEILLAAYERPAAGPPETLAGPGLVAPRDVPERLASLGRPEGLLVRGDAPSAHPEAFRTPGLEVEPEGTPLISSPLSLSRLAFERLSRGVFDDPGALEPRYSRPPPVHGAGRRD